MTLQSALLDPIAQSLPSSAEEVDRESVVAVAVSIPTIRFMQTLPGPSTSPVEVSVRQAALHPVVTVDNALLVPIAQEVVAAIASPVEESAESSAEVPESIPRIRLIQTKPGPSNEPSEVSASSEASQ